MVDHADKKVKSRAVEKRGVRPDLAVRNQEAVRQFAWTVASINFYLQEIRYFWAKALGISGPQWMILMALADMDKGEGASVKAVSKLLHVDPSFVTTQSKLLEKKGFVRRRSSVDDARVVQMSLTDKTYKQIANLAARQDELNDFIFAEMDNRELVELTGKLVQLRSRIEKASVKVAVDF